MNAGYYFYDPEESIDSDEPLWEEMDWPPDAPVEWMEIEDGDAEWFPEFEAPAPAGVGLGVAFFLALVFLLARGGPLTGWGSGGASTETTALAAPAAEIQPAPVDAPEQQAPPDPEDFGAPYADYVITQGVHGSSYGHMAIDLAAGKGAPVLSPINGVVTGNYVDQWGNPTLVIENDIYRVLLLHGVYSVEEGDSVQLGEQVGTESNRGYTTDMRGVPCAGRTDYCGYHTHLNVYDKRLESNVNPLELIEP